MKPLTPAPRSDAVLVSTKTRGLLFLLFFFFNFIYRKVETPGMLL